MGLVPEADRARRRPGHRGFADARSADHLDESRSSARAERGGACSRHAPRAGRSPSAIESRTRCAEPGPTPGSSCSTRNPDDAVARVLDEAQHRQQILDVGGVEEFEPAELDERDVAPGQLDLERAAVVRRAEQHRLLLQPGAGLAVLEDALGDVSRLIRFVAHRDELRPLAGAAVGP